MHLLHQPAPSIPAVAAACASPLLADGALHLRAATLPGRPSRAQAVRRRGQARVDPEKHGRVAEAGRGTRGDGDSAREGRDPAYQDRQCRQSEASPDTPQADEASWPVPGQTEIQVV